MIFCGQNQPNIILFNKIELLLIEHCRSGTPRKKPRQQKRSIENRVSASRILHRAIITQHKNFYYYLYACKTVVFIIIYSSIELTLVFDRTDFWFRSKRPSIELTCYHSEPCKMRNLLGEKSFRVFLDCL